MEKMVLVVSGAEEAIEKIQKYVDLGFTDIVLINLSPDRAGSSPSGPCLQ
jgi:hypothetical protein